MQGRNLLRTEQGLGISVTGGGGVAKPSFQRGNSRRRDTRRAGISMEVSGLDSDGRKFNNADEMWKEHAGDPNKKTNWYRQGVGYWEVSSNFSINSLFIYIVLTFIVFKEFDSFFFLFVVGIGGERRVWKHRWMGC